MRSLSFVQLPLEAAGSMCPGRFSSLACGLEVSSGDGGRIRSTRRR